MKNEDLSKYSVLFVDDEIQVLRAIKRGLHLEKYNKFLATDGDEALSIIEREDIAMIITDMKMPKMDGLTLLKKVNEKNPNIVKVILSGYTNLAQIIATINALNIYKFILKPWDLSTELKPIIIEGLQKYKENVKYTKNIDSSSNENELFRELVIKNEQNYEQLQMDFRNIKQLHKIVMNYSYFLSLQLKEEKMNKLRLKNELSFIEKIVSDFVVTLPTIKSITTIKNLESEVKSIIEEQIDTNGIRKMEFNSNLKDNKELPIDLVHLLWFVKMVLEDIFKVNNDSIVEIEILGSREEESIKSIEISISINALSEEYDAIRKNTLYILSSAFASILNGSFKFSGSDHKTITLTIKV